MASFPAVLAALAVVFVISARPALCEDVLTLDSDNFTSTVDAHDFIVVEFYAPWCGHCKKLAPEWEEAAGILKKEDPPIALAKVDANEEKNKDLAQKYEVQGFPTIKILKKGQDPLSYNGPREAKGIVTYVKKMAGPASELIENKEKAKEVVDSALVVVVGIFKNLDSEDFKTFSKLTEKLRSDYTFAHATDPSLFPAIGPKLGSPAVRAYLQFDDGFADYEGKFDLESLAAFVDKASTPLVAEMSKDESTRGLLMKAFNRPVPKFLVFFDYDSSAADDFKVELKKVAKAEEGLAFIYGAGKDNMQALQYFGVPEDDLPVIAIHDSTKDKKYVLEKCKPADIGLFLKKFKAGELVPKVKSEPIPEDNSGPVKVVVAKQFEEIVLSGKNVLIEFYAPWCGHCKALAPTFEKIGEHFKDDEEVVIAKLDATANDVESSDFPVSGFPTIFFRSSLGVVTPYNEADRSEESFIKFVNEHKVAASEEEKAEIKEATETEEEDKETKAPTARDEL